MQNELYEDHKTSFGQHRPRPRTSHCDAMRCVATRRVTQPAMGIIGIRYEKLLRRSPPLEQIELSNGTTESLHPPGLPACLPSCLMILF